MTPEKYIEDLKKARRSLEYVKRDIDEAIHCMERRLETGYESCETSSKVACKYAFENATTVQKTIALCSVENIEY